jgi:hypothetical protein
MYIYIFIFYFFIHEIIMHFSVSNILTKHYATPVAQLLQYILHLYIFEIIIYMNHARELPARHRAVRLLLLFNVIEQLHNDDIHIISLATVLGHFEIIIVKGRN